MSPKTEYLPNGVTRVISSGHSKLRIVLETRWQSWGDYVNGMANIKTDIPDSNSNALKVSRERDSWTRTHTYDEAIELARRGWVEPLDRIRELTASIVKDVSKTLPEVHWNLDIEGEDYDVGRLLQGEPEHWIKPDEILIKGRSKDYVHIVYNGACYGSYSPEAMIERGTVVLALAHCLEHVGISTRIDLIFSSNSTGSGLDKAYTEVTIIPMKGYSQPIDLARAAFALAHPSAFRRLQFRLRESFGGSITRTAFGATSSKPSYGSACAPPRKYQGDIYIDRNFGEEGRTKETAKQWILEQLSSMGVKANDR